MKSREGGSLVPPDLPDWISPDEQLGSVTGDRAFDTRRCYTAILDRGGNAVIPDPQECRMWREDCPAATVRNDIPSTTRRTG